MKREPPRDTVALEETERRLLGALLNEAAHSRLNGLQAEHFATAANRIIYSAILDEIADAGSAADTASIFGRIERNGDSARVGGIDGVYSLAEYGLRAEPVEKLAALVERAGRRRLAADRLSGACGALERGDEETAWQLVERAREECKPDALITAQPYSLRNASTIAPRDWLDPHKHLIRKFVSVTVGPPGVAKSSIQLIDLLSMAVGRDLHSGEALPRGPLRVWLWNLEDPLDEVERRIAAVCLHYNLSAADLGDRLHITTARDHELVIATTINGSAAVVPRVVDELVDAIRQRGIDVFCADPLVHAHHCDENASVSMGRVMEAWRMTADRGDCAVELTHHSRKNGQQDTTSEDVRGSTAVLGAVRSLRTVSTMSREDARHFGIPEDRRRFYVWTASGKASLTPPAHARRWYELVGVDLKNATATQPSDHVGVATRWSPPSAFADITMSEARAVLAALRTADPLTETCAHPKASGWVGRLCANVLGLDLGAPGVRDQIAAMVAEWERAGTIRRTGVRDARKGREVPVYVFSGVEILGKDSDDSDPI